MEVSLSTFLSGLYYYAAIIFPNALYPNAPIPDTPQNEVAKSYDIVIVGGGAAGCVLANRLSEIPSLSILLISEFGDETLISDNPLIYGLNTTIDRTAEVIPQRRACLAKGGRCGFLLGGRLGGTSAEDGMAYSRGAQEDYNHWAKEGNTDWSWSKVFPYFLKMENYKIKPLDRSPYHGAKGPLTVRYPRYQTWLRMEYMKAGKEFGWPQNDPNGKSQYGIDYPQLLLDGPTRLSAAQAYLIPAAKRENLTIIKSAKVPRIIINESNRNVEGVEYIRDGKRYVVGAKREVIVSTGTIRTPQLLILSGIGPREELKKLQIPEICDLPVGKFYKNHPAVDVYFEINKKLTITSHLWRTDTSVTEFVKSGEGPLTTTGEEAQVYFNPLDRKSKIVNVSWRIYSLYPLEGTFNHIQHRQIVTIRVTLLEPKSFGNVTLRSKNFDDVIQLNPNYFHDELDQAILTEGVKRALEYMKTPTMMKYEPKLVTDRQPVCAGAKDFAKCIVSYYSTGAHQGVGSAKMGPVVNQDLFVRGFRNLRVVDDSVMPNIIKGNPNVAAMMIAEKAADVIKKYYGIKHLEMPIFPLDYNFTSSSENISLYNYGSYGKS